MWCNYDPELSCFIFYIKVNITQLQHYKSVRTTDTYAKTWPCGFCWTYIVAYHPSGSWFQRCLDFKRENWCNALFLQIQKFIQTRIYPITQMSSSNQLQWAHTWCYFHCNSYLMSSDASSHSYVTSPFSWYGYYPVQTGKSNRFACKKFIYCSLAIYFCSDDSTWYVPTAYKADLSSFNVWPKE